MSKKKWSLLLAIFFLVQIVTSSPALSFESGSLNPPTNINVNYADPAFRNIYDAICMGIFLYKLDTVERKSQEYIKRNYPGLLFNSIVRFDLTNMDLGKKGWTRYYPFSVGDKTFIMRIFLTAEKTYQPYAPILFEGTITNPAVTFQVLPPLNDILVDCKIKPRQIYYSSEVNHSS